MKTIGRLLLALAAFVVVTTAVVSQAEDTPRIHISLGAGGNAHLAPLPLFGDEGQKVTFRVRFEGQEENLAGLTVAVVSRLGDEELQPIDHFNFGAGEVASGIFLIAHASSCCQSGDISGAVEIGRGPDEPIVVPFDLEVDASPFRCWQRSLLLTVLFAVLVLVISGAVLNFRKLPSAPDLAEHLSYRGKPQYRPEIERMLADACRWQRRLGNWWRSLPWRACLPGGLYLEAIRIHLSNKGPAQSTAALVPESNLPRHWADSNYQRGSLYAVATQDGGVDFVALPEKRGEEKFVAGLRVQGRSGRWIQLGQEDGGWRVEGRLS